MSRPPLEVCLLWHMHQPCYHNAATGESSLPWVRLHATKAYLDMAEACRRAPEGVRCTVNFVPVLLDQLARYERDEVKDRFLELSRRAASDLALDEVAFILRYFFMANWETMVKPHPRYGSLLLKRGMDRSTWDLEASAKRFSAAEIRDLQVWFNLSWFGWAAKARFPAVAEMIAKGSQFTEDDKAAVLAAQLDCIRAIVPAWRELSEAGKVEMTATPFYHPILPLLINSRHAARAVPDMALPDDFVAPEDAEAQVAKAVQFHERTWGTRPQGMWPAEGSVSPEVVPVFRRAGGIQWIASDEDVLFASLGRRNREQDLYRPWKASHGGEEIAVFFRDRVLSDLVGFTYSKMAPADAADDFLARVGAIHASAQGDKPCAAVILDGENPWEYYADGGEGFLDRLYQGLGRTPGIRAQTFSRHLKEREGRIEPLGVLHSGSWISANYRIWIGHPEDNAGWNLLKRAREEIRRHIAHGHVHGDGAAEAMDSLYRAEGSDWFWWFGDDFTSDNDAEFDLLFRTHISNAYRAAGIDPPSALLQPISKAGKGASSTGTRAPFAFISPRIDGEAATYFEWKGAGYYSVGKSEGTMHKGTAYLSGIHYGFDLENLYLRLDPVSKLTDEVTHPTFDTGAAHDLRIAISLAASGPRQGASQSFADPVEYRLHFPFVSGVESYELFGPKGDEKLARLHEESGIGYQRVVEIRVPVSAMQLEPGGHIDFSVRVLLDEVEIDRYPRNGAIRVDVPTPDFERVNWWV